jgi:polysaccharide chain length determinant protein (PEP-CTERM system associated)
MLRRRWRLILLPSIAGVAIGFALIHFLPKRYTSQSLLLVEQQQVPNTYVEPIVTEDLNARIAHIEEQTLSRTRLEPIIERYRLFKKDAAGYTMDELVLRMQKLVGITPVKPVVQTQDETIPGFYLSVTLDDPRQAQEVCTDLASMFVDEDIRERESSAQGTTSFLQSQLADAKRKLDEEDARLAEFERKYMGMLPDETTTNLSMLGTLNTQLDAVTQALNRAQQDEAYAQSVLAQQLQSLKLMQEMKDGYVPVEGADPLHQQLAQLEAQLAMLQARYTPDYPDIVSTKDAIARLKQQIGSPAKVSTKGKSGKAQASSAAEPPQIQQLRAQVNGDEETIKIDTREQQQVRDAIKVYEARLRLSPAIDEQYKKITRDHDSALKFYNGLLGKRDQSQMASELERRQEGEQLSVMDPANLPDKPSFPKPRLFIGGGFAAGLALGAALALFFEQNEKRVRTERDVEFYLGTHAFAIIPSIDVAVARIGERKNGTSKKQRQPLSVTKA